MLNRGAALRDTLAAVGVIGSLIFVGLEVRQNTKAVQAAAIQDFSDAFREQVQLYVSDPGMTNIRVRANQDLSSRTAEESQRFFGLYLSGMVTLQGAFRQWQLGVLPDEEWAFVQVAACVDMQLPTSQELWSQVRWGFAPSFVEALESSCDSAAPN